MKTTTVEAIKILFRKLIEEKELGNNQLAYIAELLLELEQ